MFKNHLKIAWRNLTRNKSFSLLNVLGLSIGLSVTALILLWVSYELNVDRFHENKDRIYQVYNKYEVGGEIWTWNSTPKIMAPVIKEDYPEIEAVSRFFYDNTLLFSKEEKKIKSTGTMVDPDFLKIFSFPLAEGSIETVFEEVNSVVITQDLAKKLFGNASAIGKIVKVDNTESFKVTGVLENLPVNSEFTFEFLIPWSYLKQKGWDDENWSNNSVATFVLLKKGTDHSVFSEKIKTLRREYDLKSPDMITYMYPFTRSNLYAEFENGNEVGGKIVAIRLFTTIAIIVLIIACINFMNLSTARSEKRAKEVGIRKTIGAYKASLIKQFIGESLLISLLSALIGLVIVVMALPSFSQLVGQELILDWSNPWFWVAFFSIVFVTGILAGSYPALYLSSFRPASVLKGTFRKINAHITPRKVLVVGQFTVSIVLITATIVVKQQLSHAQKRSTGYLKDRLIYVPIEGETLDKYELIKKELLASEAASSVTKTMSPITENWSNSWNISWPGKDREDKTLIFRFNADDDVIETFGLELVEGRDFDKRRFPTDSTAMIINEAAAKHMGFDKPIGMEIEDDGQKWHVIGVVKNFIMTSPFRKIEPMIIHSRWGNNFVDIKLNSNRNVAENLAQVEEVFKKHNPKYPFDYKFVDSEYARKFEDEKQTEELSSLFTLLTMLISCLGLFGLASYMAENRIKEIGVRKVLGASVQSVTALLSKDFLKLVSVSIVLAIPLSWYIMGKWLEEFAYRISLSWWTFGIAGVLAMAIALLTVSYQAIKAAKENPIKSLRTE